MLIMNTEEVLHQSICVIIKGGGNTVIRNEKFGNNTQCFIN